MCDSITTADSGGKKRIHMSLFLHSERGSVKWPFLRVCMNLALEKRFWEYFSKYMISLAVLFQNSVVGKENLIYYSGNLCY